MSYRQTIATIEIGRKNGRYGEARCGEEWNGVGVVVDCGLRANEARARQGWRDGWGVQYVSARKHIIHHGCRLRLCFSSWVDGRGPCRSRRTIRVQGTFPKGLCWLPTPLERRGFRLLPLKHSFESNFLLCDLHNIRTFIFEHIYQSRTSESIPPPARSGVGRLGPSFQHRGLMAGEICREPIHLPFRSTICPTMPVPHLLSKLICRHLMMPMGVAIDEPVAEFASPVSNQ